MLARSTCKCKETSLECELRVGTPLHIANKNTSTKKAAETNQNVHSDRFTNQNKTRTKI